MSTFYNLIAGNHPAQLVLLSALGATDEGKISLIPRLRDVYLFPEEIRILTRTGGGNREEYEESNEWLRSFDTFLRDWDDEYDDTYAWWAYSWPDAWRPQLQHMLETIQEEAPELLPASLRPVFETAIERLKEKGSERQDHRPADDDDREVPS